MLFFTEFSMRCATSLDAGATGHVVSVLPKKLPVEGKERQKGGELEDRRRFGESLSVTPVEMYPPDSNEPT